MLFYEEINGCWSMGKFYKLIWLKIYSYTVYSILIFLNNNRKKKLGKGILKIVIMHMKRQKLVFYGYIYGRLKSKIFYQIFIVFLEYPKENKEESLNLS